jgi:probable HAF family extracellular repeat protein
MLTRVFRPALLAVFLLGLLQAGQPAGAVTYSLTDLGVFTNAPSPSATYVSQPNNINNAGQIAAGTLINGTYQARLYTGGNWVNLGNLGGGNSQSEGLNEAGWVVGQSLTAAIGGDNHAFLWIPGSTNGIAGNPQMQDLGTPGHDSESGDINNKGIIAGWENDPGTGNDNAFSYNCSNGVMLNLSNSIIQAAQNVNFNTFSFVNLSGDSYGHAINDLGHIVGWAYDNNIAGNQAFLWTNSAANSNGTALLLGDLNGGYSGSEALGINNSDQITGDAKNFNGDVHAFRYSVASGVLTDLGVLGNGDYSSGNSINNSNAIVGLSNLGQAGLYYHAIIAVSNRVADLNTLVDASGTNWVLVEANFINDSGRIVGYGTNLADGLLHCFLLTPVVPGVFSPKITAFAVSKTNVVLKFTTTNAATYYVESRTNLKVGGWSNLVSGIAGTGGTNTVTNTAATSGTRFFRVRQTIP